MRSTPTRSKGNIKMNTNGNNADITDKLKNASKDVRVWIAGALAVAIVVVVAVISTHREPVKEAQQGSAYVLSDNDAKAIKKLVSNVVIDCGTWGDDTNKVNKDNAGDFYENAKKYALNDGRLPAEQAQFASSRWDRRTLCLMDYVSNMSPMQTAHPTPSEKDAMMTYTVEGNEVSVSNPKDSKLYVNNNSRSSLVVKASWTSMEAGLYQTFNATMSPKENGAGDVSLTPTGWADFSKEHKFKDIKFTVEKQSDKWKLVDISGDNWITDGYVNALSSYVGTEDGAERALNPSEQPQQMPEGADKQGGKKKSSDDNNTAPLDENATTTTGDDGTGTVDGTTD